MLFTGVTGNIGIGTGSTATKLAHMANWNIDDTTEIIEVVSFGSKYKEKIPSIQDWSASCDGKVDFASTAGQTQLSAAKSAGTMVQCTFYLADDTFYEGDGYIESLNISTAADGAADISISIAGSGPLEQVLPT